MLRGFTVVLTLLVAACGADVETTPDVVPTRVPTRAPIVTTPARPAATHTVEGVVRTRPPYPAPVTVSLYKLERRPADGEGRVADPSTVVAPDGGVENALVYIVLPTNADRPFPPPVGAVTVPLPARFFVDARVGVRVGQPLHLVNTSILQHQIGVMSDGSDRAAVVRQAGETATFAFDTPERGIRIGCPCGVLRAASVTVFDHPYFATTTADGRFRFEDLAPGTYEVRAIHARFGTARVTLVVSASGAEPVEIVVTRRE